MTSITSSYTIAELRTFEYNHDEIKRVLHLIGEFNREGRPLITTHRTRAWFKQALAWLVVQGYAKPQEVGTMHTALRWHLTPKGRIVWVRLYERL